MKPRLLFMLLLCALLLTACYRQTEEPFQQVDSAAVVSVATPTSIEAVDEDGAVTAGEEVEAAAEVTQQYVTPETVPGQVEQPTIELPTAVPTEATSPAQTLTPFIRPTATLAFVEELDPNHECVYTVQSGDNLFRISLSWNTTVQEIMDASQIESDALSIGQLLLRPGCEYTAPTARPLESPASVVIEATSTPAGPPIHVVSAGETIESISLKYRVDVNQLIALNNLTNPSQLAVGQELLLPE